MQHRIFNAKDPSRPYSCPKCGGEVGMTEYVEYTVEYSIDPATGGESDEKESKMHDVDDAQYYCIADGCGWQVWRNEYGGPEDQQLPEKICDDGSVALPSPM